MRIGSSSGYGDSCESAVYVILLMVQHQLTCECASVSLERNEKKERVKVFFINFHFFLFCLSPEFKSR